MNNLLNPPEAFFTWGMTSCGEAVSLLRSLQHSFETVLL
jgi:hypothetical protein